MIFTFAEGIKRRVSIQQRILAGGVGSKEDRLKGEQLVGITCRQKKFELHSKLEMKKDKWQRKMEGCVCLVRFKTRCICLKDSMLERTKYCL